VFLDRGEVNDRSNSGFTTTFVVLSLIDMVGAIFRLLNARKPVVDLRVLRDKNLALGSVWIAGFTATLHGSVVLVAQLAQQ
jgi:MFS transporter, DHA2 family, multidrug resistance protein